MKNSSSFKTSLRRWQLQRHFSLSTICWFLSESTAFHQDSNFLRPPIYKTKILDLTLHFKIKNRTESP